MRRAWHRLLDEDLVALAAMLDEVGEKLHCRFHRAGEEEKRPGAGNRLWEGTRRDPQAGSESTGSTHNHAPQITNKRTQRSV